MKTSEDIFKLLSQIPDPEIPVISIIDLGVIRDIQMTDESSITLKILKFGKRQLNFARRFTYYQKKAH